MIGAPWERGRAAPAPVRAKGGGVVEEPGSGPVFVGRRIELGPLELLGAIDRLESSAPVVLVLDDLEWADDDSLPAVRFALPAPAFPTS